MKNNKNIKMYPVLFVVCLVFLLIAAQMVNLQIIRHEEYSYMAIELSKKDIDKYAKRGEILDRNEVRLAYSAKFYDLWVNVKDVGLDKMTAEQRLNFENTTQMIQDYIGVTKDVFMQKLNESLEKQRNSFELQRYVSKEVIDYIMAKGNPRWLSSYESYKRIYPVSTLASNLIGITSKDGNGIAGIEYAFDDYLSGTNGKYVMDTDVYGNQLALSSTEKFEPEDGLNTVLTIDSVMQQYLMAAMLEHYESLKPKRMIALISDIKSGELLAMANYPTYDQNNPRLVPDTTTDDPDYVKKLYEMWANPAVSMLYEPGSVSKIITMSAGLEEGVFDLETQWTDNNAQIRVEDRWLKCATFPDPHGTNTTEMALIRSCNVAFVQMEQKMGKNTLYDYMQGFNLTYRSNLGVSDPAPLFTTRDKLINVDAATMSYGHGYNVTPVQMIAAANAVVNDGKLMEPYLLKKLITQDNKVEYEAQPKELRQVISPSTSAAMRNTMEKLVKYYKLDTKGVTVGGKTGTSLKLTEDPLTKKMVYGKEVIASFYAFAPVQDPRYSILLIVDEPQSDKIRGLTTAPIAIQALIDSMQYAGLTNQDVRKEAQVQVPDVSGMTHQQAVDTLQKAGFSVTAVGYDALREQVVEDQYPKAKVTAVKETKVIIKMVNK